MASPGTIGLFTHIEKVASTQIFGIERALWAVHTGQANPLHENPSLLAKTKNHFLKAPIIDTFGERFLKTYDNSPFLYREPNSFRTIPFHDGRRLPLPRHVGRHSRAANVAAPDSLAHISTKKRRESDQPLA
jgi:hypothetical protein